MTHIADDLAAALLDDVGRVALERMAERIIRRDEEPCVLAALDHGAPGDIRQRIGIVSVVNENRRAGLAGEIRTARAGIHEDLVLLGQQRRDCQRHRRSRHVENGVDLVVVDPVACDVDANVRLVLVIARDHLDRLAFDLAAEIRHGHLYGGQRSLAGSVGIEAGHVGEDADLDDIVGDLCMRRAAGKSECEAGHERGSGSVHGVCSLGYFCFRVAAAGTAQRRLCQQSRSRSK